MFGMIKNSLFGGVEVNNGTVLKNQEKDGIYFEERTYEGGRFATVELSGKPFDEAMKECVLKLLKYVGGSNQKGAGMGMTSPVSIISYPKDNTSFQQKVKVFLRIPSQFQADPPVPMDHSICIEDREGLSVYAIQFGGFAKEADYIANAAKLSSCLGPEASYSTEYYICCGYDPPMKPYGRRNEVWFVKNN